MVVEPDQMLLCRNIATKAHYGQFRRGENEAKRVSYINHPVAVARACWQKVMVLPDGRERTSLVAVERATTLYCIAMLHDVLEDTPLRPIDLERKGVDPHVIDMVEVLTKRPREPYREYIWRVGQHHDATFVKVADIKHNLSCSPRPASVEKYKKALAFLDTPLPKSRERLEEFFGPPPARLQLVEVPMKGVLTRAHRDLLARWLQWAKTATLPLRAWPLTLVEETERLLGGLATQRKRAAANTNNERSNNDIHGKLEEVR